MLNDVLVFGGCLVGDCEELGLGSTIIEARPRKIVERRI
jgi:hypothetical protein